MLLIYSQTYNNFESHVTPCSTVSNSKGLKTTKWPATRDWKNKLWYNNTMEYYASIKKEQRSSLWRDMERSPTFLSFFLCFIYFWDRERQSISGRGAERERETQNLKQAPGSELQHRAWRRARTHVLCDHDVSWSQTLNQLSHPGAPTNISY